MAAGYHIDQRRFTIIIECLGYVRHCMKHFLGLSHRIFKITQ